MMPGDGMTVDQGTVRSRHTTTPTEVQAQLLARKRLA
jgi:hypothetical protein